MCILCWQHAPTLMLLYCRSFEALIGSVQSKMHVLAMAEREQPAALTLTTSDCGVQNLEPVLSACPELQKLNLASCALLGENALDALLPAGARGSPSRTFTQVAPSAVKSLSM